MLKNLSRESEVIIITSNVTEVVQKFLESKRLDATKVLLAEKKKLVKYGRLKQ